MALVLVAALFCLVVIGVRSSRDHARSAQHVNNMKQLGLGLLNFESTFKAFPSAY